MYQSVYRRGFVCLLITLAMLAAVPLAAKPATYGSTPLMFERNDGQLADAVRFHGRGAGYSVFLTGNETVLRLHRAENESAVVRWQLTGANASAPMRGEAMLAAKSNYLHGSDAAQWRTNVANFSRVRQTSVYPGVDVVYRGNDRQLEYDFVVAPRADASRIRMAIAGADSMSIDKDGALVLHLHGGDLVQPRPVVYQERNGKRTHVDGRYALLGRNEVGFILGRYDRSRPLVIDPVVLYATYLGGNLWDSSIGIAVDGSGNAYITGLVESTNFPTLNAIQSTDTYDYDAYVAKFNSTGALVYSTYLGGNGGNEYGYNVALDSSNNVYVLGGTNSTDFPGVTGSSIQSSNGGGFRDVFLTKINSSGSAIVYSTYLGGSGDEWAYGLDVDGSGNAYLAGGTDSTNLTGVGGGSLQSTKSSSNDGFVMKVNAAGSALVYSTYIGGTGNDSFGGIRLDGSGNLWISGTSTGSSFPGITGSSLQSANAGGYDGVILKLNSTFSSIVYATFHGGSGDESCTRPALDSSGNVLVSGYTNSTSLPGVSGSSLQSSNAGAYDEYVTKFNSTLSSYVFSTFYGGSGNEGSVDVQLDSSGNVYFGGYSNSSTLPGITGTSMQPANAGGYDLTFTKLNSSGTSVTWSTFLGGTGDDEAYRMAIDSSANLYMCGVLLSTDFPTTPGAAQTTHAGGDGDAFIAKVGEPGTPVVTSVSPTSGRAGDSITITGYNFDNYQGAGGQVCGWAARTPAPSRAGATARS